MQQGPSEGREEVTNDGHDVGQHVVLADMVHDGQVQEAWCLHIRGGSDN